jgi:hypothetical protein
MPKLDVAALFLLLGPLLAPSVGAAAAEGCHLNKLDPSPTWVGSGAFSEKGEVLLIANPGHGVILPYSRQDGRLLDALPPRLNKTLQAVRPQVIQQQGDQLYLEVAQNKLVTLGTSYAFMGKKSMVTEGTTGQMAGSYLWQPVGSDFLSITDIQLPKEGAWWGAIVRFPANNPAAYSVLQWMPLTDPSRIFYRLGYPYLASLGDDGYLLKMDNVPGIYRSSKKEPGLRPLGALEGILGQSPTLPAFSTKRDAVQIMAKAERSKMPTGLYGWKDSLYVVMRQPERQGTRWTIYKIKPEGMGEVVGSAQIPTRANHLTVVPGDKSWAFIEKGPVEAWGRQQVGNVLFVPADRIDKIDTSKQVALCGPSELTLIR